MHVWESSKQSTDAAAGACQSAMDISGWRVILEERASRLFESDVFCIITQVKLLEKASCRWLQGAWASWKGWREERAWLGRAFWGEALLGGCWEAKEPAG